MRPSLLIAGSGKMARNVGMFFFERGWPVAWVSHSCEQLAKLENEATRRAKRMARLFGEPASRRQRPRNAGETPALPTFAASFHTYSSLPSSAPQIILETTRESLGAKGEVFRGLEPLITKDTLLLTNSSSFLPREIHADCLGLHFFYPVELTGIAELICTDSRLHAKKERLLSLLRENGFAVLEQDADSAFLANRLLLPLQAECLRALTNGWPPAMVEKASKSKVLPVGQLALMDSIGLDVLAAAVRAYQGRMTPEKGRGYEKFASSLEELLAIGKLGGKNRDGFLLGAPLPWPSRLVSDREYEDLAATLPRLFIHGCRQALESGQINRQDLNRLLELLFHCGCSIEELVV